MALAERGACARVRVQSFKFNLVVARLKCSRDYIGIRVPSRLRLSCLEPPHQACTRHRLRAGAGGAAAFFPPGPNNCATSSACCSAGVASSASGLRVKDSIVAYVRQLSTRQLRKAVAGAVVATVDSATNYTCSRCSGTALLSPACSPVTGCMLPRLAPAVRRRAVETRRAVGSPALPPVPRTALRCRPRGLTGRGQHLLGRDGRPSGGVPPQVEIEKEREAVAGRDATTTPRVGNKRPPCAARLTWRRGWRRTSNS